MKLIDKIVLRRVKGGISLNEYKVEHDHKTVEWLNDSFAPF